MRTPWIFSAAALAWMAASADPALADQVVTEYYPATWVVQYTPSQESVVCTKDSIQALMDTKSTPQKVISAEPIVSSDGKTLCDVYLEAPKQSDAIQDTDSSWK